MPKVCTDDGMDIHYKVDDFRDPWADGSDEAIFMHHGFGRNMKWWTQWVPSLSRRHKVVRYDCRGCGESSIPAEDASWSAERIVKDVVALIDHLQIKRIHWIGFESGGIFGIVFAALYPDRVASLTLINTPYKILDQPMSVYAQGQPKPSEAIAKLGLRQWLVETMDVRMDLSLADPRLVEWHVNEHSKTPTHVAVGLFRDIVEVADVSSLLPKVQAPTLIMTGDRSANCPIDDQYYLYDQIPDSRIVVFPGIGGGIQLLIPERCTEETLQFIESLQCGGG